MSKSLYGHMRDTSKGVRKGEVLDLVKSRLVVWRRDPVVNRVERPTQIHRARALGYKAKPGVIVVRTRVRRGGMRKVRPVRGRKPAKMGVNKYTAGRGLKAIAETRVGKKYPNMEVLNSYWVAEDGRHKFFEVILVDRSHPAVLADKNLSWVANPASKNRAFRGKTSAGRKHRGLHHKGMGAEKIRPSVRANGRKSN